MNLDIQTPTRYSVHHHHWPRFMYAWGMATCTIKDYLQFCILVRWHDLEARIFQQHSHIKIANVGEVCLFYLQRPDAARLQERCNQALHIEVVLGEDQDVIPISPPSDDSPLCQHIALQDVSLKEPPKTPICELTAHHQAYACAPDCPP